ncbi:RHS repeat-associated core domain-containing protein [Maricaulis sp.]|uniref:RHS repeat-associated core domain-containing protein n=1 Tax=Maricaulis sp. TaxID=1486257 RepID=UPI003A947BE0
MTDTDTGMVYMQARYYDPAIGRFLSGDPVGFASGGPGYFNRYAYVGNDPVNGVDPTGRRSRPSGMPRMLRWAWHRWFRM